MLARSRKYAIVAVDFVVEAHQMECPKCYGEMATVIESPTQVDRCDNCHGLYFDQLTQGLLDGLLGQEGVDTGSEEMGSEYNEMVFVDCPKCDKMMDQRLIEEPVRIRFDQHPSP